MKNFIHQISNINKDKLTGFCSECGIRTPLRKYKKRGTRFFNYRCSNQPKWKDRYLTKGARKYIYLIKMKSPDGFVKIGTANDVSKRLKFLQTCSPYDLEVVFSLEIHSAFQLEKGLHKQFKEKHIQGEWFSLSNEDVQIIKEALLTFAQKF